MSTAGGMTLIGQSFACEEFMSEEKKLVSIITGCLNEEGNIGELYERIINVMSSLPQYDYEIICIDNCSTDGTREEIKKICAMDPKFKAIFNVRNFGQIRSPYHAFLQASGDAVIAMCSDLQDPPELLPEMLKKWEDGYKLAMVVSASSDEKWPFRYLRKLFYWALDKVSDVRQVPGMTGFGLYDKDVQNAFRALNSPYPYNRGLISEFGWKIAEIPYHKPDRKRGVTKNNLITLFDMSLLAMVHHTKLPLRLATLTGVGVSFLSFCVAIFYLLRKLIYWDQFQAGIAPALIGLFFIIGILFLFLGLIGEYVGFITTYMVRFPLVVEEARINFDEH
ncbi:MAG: glycosyltransferase family 2 protein [Deltaproteobacteria bacterium]|nr:glycosyltransferase family 2 protein [Deltaproteobacteria bacterium]